MVITDNDSWVVLGPTRTGSTVILSCIIKSYSAKKIQLKFFGTDSKLVPVPPRSIWHYHDLNILNYKNDNTNVVISTRDPVESALSYCIVEQFGHWHLQRENTKLIFNITRKVPKYTISKSMFLDRLASINTWYDLVPEHFLRIDYSAFEHNISNVYKILDIPIPSNDTDITIMKNPYLLKEWILNWDEISEVIKELPNFSN